jgi:hypothetical protein
MLPDPTVIKQAYASGLRHGEHHYGLEVFFVAPDESRCEPARLEPIFDQRKRRAHCTHAVQPGTVMSRQENGAGLVRASDTRVHDNQGD